MSATRYPDEAEYRLEVIAKRERAKDRRTVYVRTGWCLVKYPDVPESWEPMDVGSDMQSDFKEITGFHFVEDGYNFNSDIFPGGSLYPKGS